LIYKGFEVPEDDFSMQTNFIYFNNFVEIILADSK
jgi:hypothetical protein